MKPIQQVLFAFPRHPTVRALADELKRIEVPVLLASSHENAARISEIVPNLSLIVVDAVGSPEQAASMLAHVKDRNRHCPVLWVGTKPTGMLQPDEVLSATASTDALIEAAELLMLDDLYPADLVRELVSACNVALTSSFDCPVECAEPRISRSAVRSGGILSFMIVGDGNVSAHCMVSAEEKTLLSISERLGFLPSHGPRQLAIDIAGELVNQIVGRIKSSSELFANVRLGLAYGFAGAGLCVYQPSPKPSLAVQIDVGSAPISVDFWFHSRHKRPPHAPEVADLCDADGLF